MTIYDTELDFLGEHPDLVEKIRMLLKVTANRRLYGGGFAWDEVVRWCSTKKQKKIMTNLPQFFHTLAKAGLLESSGKTGGRANYKWVDRPAVTKALQAWDKGMWNQGQNDAGTGPERALPATESSDCHRTADGVIVVPPRPVSRVPDWSDLQGYDDVKKLVEMWLRGQPNGMLIEGSPGSGKTLIIEAVQALDPTVPTVFGGTGTKVGIREHLLQFEPTICTIDEIDKFQQADLAIYYPFLENGLVPKILGGRGGIQYKKLTCWNMAACNDASKVPEAIRDRLGRDSVYIKPYTEAEFRAVVQFLAKRRKLTRRIADMICHAAWMDGVPSVRAALNYMKYQPDDIPEMISIRQKHRKRSK